MKAWHRIALAVFVVAVLAGLVWRASCPREPTYKGRTLSAWLEQYSGNGGPIPREPTEAARAEAATAIRQIGTNGIPCLLRMAAAEDSPAKKWILAHIPAPNVIGQRLLSQPLFFRWATKAVIGPLNACNGFKLLGSEAKSAAPGLVHLMARGKNNMARLHTVVALGGIGPAAENALPALIENLNDPFNELRDRTVGALFEIAFDRGKGQFRPACSRVMVPRLTELLNDPKADALRVIRLLGDIGPDAKAALPAIVSFQDSQDSNIRAAAVKARERIETRP